MVLYLRPKRNGTKLPRSATRRAATRTTRTEVPSPVPSSSHQPGDPEHEELLMSDTGSRRDTEYCRVRYPDVDNFDLFDDEDNSQSSQPLLSQSSESLLSQSSQSLLLQSSFGAPITPMPARKRSCQERAETRTGTEQALSLWRAPRFGV
ncbi:unnamed protein product [Heligmosomoides polygyrus]|uniref:Uncharacterized protein n=1 Tax=Heligmosomoides polygyrus TaxID=6339 RepID=A0A183GW36_HELPZ|nr:unnamed protein product [Heligmosomoides polygyrus]